MIGNTISHYKILEKLGIPARPGEYTEAGGPARPGEYTEAGGPARRSSHDLRPGVS